LRKFPYKLPINLKRYTEFQLAWDGKPKQIIGKPNKFGTSHSPSIVLMATPILCGVVQ
jgi:hypothetical protein